MQNISAFFKNRILPVLLKTVAFLKAVFVSAWQKTSGFFKNAASTVNAKVSAFHKGKTLPALKKISDFFTGIGQKTSDFHRSKTVPAVKNTAAFFKRETKPALRRTAAFLKKEMMLSVSLVAAVISLFITPPSVKLLGDIDWKTLATLFMLLSVLDGFKSEDLFRPVIRLAGGITGLVSMSFFLVFSVFFSSMFVTNDVSLIIFVPLTIMFFRAGGKEQYTIPMLCLENIAAVRGSLLTPFGSPQNLFLYGRSGLSAGKFVMMMLPIWILSIILLAVFIVALYRKEEEREIDISSLNKAEGWQPERRTKRIVYFSLFALILVSIVTRTKLWPIITVFVAVMLFIFDRPVFKRVDYVLLLTFLCFFVFSSSLAGNEKIAAFLQKSVSGNEYVWSIVLSQVISNVPASIVLWPFTSDLRPLIYGLDTAGLVTVIGSLASVINMRIYTREYPGNGKKFMMEFEKICLMFFIIVFFPQLLMCGG